MNDPVYLRIFYFSNLSFVKRGGWSCQLEILLTTHAIVIFLQHGDHLGTAEFRRDRLVPGEHLAQTGIAHLDGDFGQVLVAAVHRIAWLDSGTGSQLPDQRDATNNKYRKKNRLNHHHANWRQANIGQRLERRLDPESRNGREQTPARDWCQ